MPQDWIARRALWIATWMLASCVARVPHTPSPRRTVAVRAAPATPTSPSPCRRPLGLDPSDVERLPETWQRVTPLDAARDRVRAVALPSGGRLWLGRRLEREESDGVIHTVCDGLGEDPTVAVQGDTLMAWDRCGHPAWGVWRSDDGGRHCVRNAAAPFVTVSPPSPTADLVDLRVTLGRGLAAVWNLRGEAVLWTTTDLGRTWARLAPPRWPLVSAVATDAGDLFVLSNGASAHGTSTALALSRWNVDARRWDTIDAIPPLRAEAVTPTMDARVDGSLWLVDDFGVTHVPRAARRVQRAGPPLLDAWADRHEGLPLRVYAVGDGAFVGSYAPFAAFVRLTEDGLAPWAEAPRALPPMVFWPDGAGGLFARGDDGVASVHQTVDGVWRASGAAPLGAEFMTALAARGRSLAMVGALGAVAWTVDGGVQWSTARLPAAVGHPYRAVFTDAARLVIVGTGASARLTLSTEQVESIPLPDGVRADATAPPRPQDGACVLRAARGAAELLLEGAVYTLTPEHAQWRPRFGCPGATGCVSIPRARLLALDEGGGLWILDGEHRAYSLDPASDRLEPVTLPVAHVFNTARAMAVTSRGSIAVATDAYIERMRLDGARDVRGDPLPWSDPGTEVVGLLVGERVTVVLSSQRVDPDDTHHREVTARVRHDDGSWRTVGSGFDVWAQDGDDLYVGRGDAVWRASVRTLLGVVEAR